MLVPTLKEGVHAVPTSPPPPYPICACNAKGLEVNMAFPLLLHSCMLLRGWEEASSHPPATFRWMLSTGLGIDMYFLPVPGYTLIKWLELTQWLLMPLNYWTTLLYVWTPNRGLEALWFGARRPCMFKKPLIISIWRNSISSLMSLLPYRNGHTVGTLTITFYIYLHEMLEYPNPVQSSHNGSFQLYSSAHYI